MTAAVHAAGLLHDGFTIAQVVHNDGGIGGMCVLELVLPLENARYQ